MNRKFIGKAALTVLALPLLMLTVSPASAGTWQVDAAHSEVNFSIKHFFTPVTGRFADFAIDLVFDEANPEKSSVAATIQVASVDTGNEKRDGHLSTGDFFDTENFPTMTFKSNSIESTKDGLVAHGTLTIRDKSLPVDLAIDHLGTKDVPEQMRAMFGGSEKVASFKATTSIDRGDFGVGSGNFAATAVVGGNVDIELLVEAHYK